MITLFIIIIVIVVACIANSTDSKSKKELARIEEETLQLPDLYFRMHEMTTAQKAFNLFPSDKDLLDIFKYEANTRNITLTMKDGRSVTCPLSELYVQFDKVSGHYRFVIKNSGTKFSFYKFNYVFTDKEWDIIIGVLMLAGQTSNISIMGSTYKNLSKANTILKIIKAIS